MLPFGYRDSILRRFKIDEPVLEFDCFYNGTIARAIIDAEKMRIVKKPYVSEGMPHTKLYRLDEIEIKEIKEGKSAVKISLAHKHRRFSLVLTEEEKEAIEKLSQFNASKI